MKQIALRGKHGVGKFALVDDEDFEELNKYKWHCLNKKYTSYARRSGFGENTDKHKSVLMHRLIAGCSGELVIDHINHNGLDNRKENLRICTRRENNRNVKISKGNALGEYLIYKRTGYRGYHVAYSTKTTKSNRKYFLDLQDAIKFRDAILEKHYNFTSNLRTK